MERFPVGHAGHTIELDPAWRVLDVGSGHNPHPRANVLLEKAIDDTSDRAGAAVDVADPRLVVGDGLDMPFADRSFDYAIASHIAEHVDDPLVFCRELQRVAWRGYIETPGPFGDRVLREDYHHWRVARTQGGLRFREVRGTDRPFGKAAEAFYVLIYYGETRPGHRTLRFRFAPSDLAMRFVRKGLGRAIRMPPMRHRFYTCFEWHDGFDCSVEWLDGRVTR
jgi:hypothetical protein